MERTNIWRLSNHKKSTQSINFILKKQLHTFNIIKKRMEHLVCEKLSSETRSTSVVTDCLRKLFVLINIPRQRVSENPSSGINSFDRETACLSKMIFLSSLLSTQLSIIKTSRAGRMKICTLDTYWTVEPKNFGTKTFMIISISKHIFWSETLNHYAIAWSLTNRKRIFKSDWWERTRCHYFYRWKSKFLTNPDWFYHKITDKKIL